jgi:hypothetical protein
MLIHLLAGGNAIDQDDRVGVGGPTLAVFLRERSVRTVTDQKSRSVSGPPTRDHPCRIPRVCFSERPRCGVVGARLGELEFV